MRDDRRRQDLIQLPPLASEAVEQTAIEAMYDVKGALRPDEAPSKVVNRGLLFGLHDFVVLVGLQIGHALRFPIRPSDLNGHRPGSRFAAEAENYAVVVRGEDTRSPRDPTHQLAVPLADRQLRPDGVAVARGPHQLGTNPGIVLPDVIA